MATDDRSNSRFRPQFYPSRITYPGLVWVTRVSSQMIYLADTDGTEQPLHRWLFEEAIAELHRRADIRNDVQFVESEPLRLPNWRPALLASAMINATSLTYLELPTPDVAALADWLLVGIQSAVAAELHMLDPSYVI